MCIYVMCICIYIYIYTYNFIYIYYSAALLHYPPASINESTEVLGAAFQLPVSALLTGFPHVPVQVFMNSFLQEEKHSKRIITFTGNLFTTNSKARLTCCKCCASCFCLGARLEPPNSPFGAPLSLPSSFQEFLDCYRTLQSY